jgi:hypothetical protein
VRTIIKLQADEELPAIAASNPSDADYAVNCRFVPGHPVTLRLPHRVSLGVVVQFGRRNPRVKGKPV